MTSTSARLCAQPVAPPLPPEIAAAVWHADQLGAPISSVVATGHAPLDAELPGGGWPCRALIEILTPQPAVLEWRLLGHALAQVVRAGRQMVVVGPPRRPHLPGLRQLGLDERRMVWVDAQTPTERLWSTEQVVQSNSAAVVAWLPQVRPEQLRRLQVHAQQCDGPVFVCRPAAARHEASAAPLRVWVALGDGMDLQVQVFKRRGPAQDGSLQLPSPGGLGALLMPLRARPAVDPDREGVEDVLGGAAVSPPRRLAAVR